ncbi:hypothetical protein RCL_jg1102.t1 [Rhizophagus clarus]|uniref:2-cysteine adaptor domain-containing protein n=1 Tax=Rhizophagus clarus TaxID=94130 RepID=A0A8H3R5E7_9GLOM|nr:hypothetical protein RCL_jg1102.t1 [Rhizophagus clarus]
MSANRYTINPLTGRTIRVGGPTFNQLVIEAYDYLNSGLVRRATAPPLTEVRQSYLNIETGRMVQYGTRTYFHLIQHVGYEIIEDYYLVPPRYVEIAQSNPSLLYWQDTPRRLELLETAITNRINFYAEWNQRNPDYRQRVEETRQFVERRQRETQQEAQLRRLAELNIALCKECQMPVNLNKLPENGLCEDCSKEEI